MKALILFILWFDLIYNIPITTNSKLDKDNYRAALYSMRIDFSRTREIVPEIHYSIPGLSTVSYKYFIQYGRDTLIEILDPGIDIKAFTGCIKEMDYAKRESTFTCYIDQSKTYYTTNDSITYSIDECRGDVADLCNEVKLNSSCDSLKFTMHSPEIYYTVIINDTIPNIRSSSLLYPDIEYLPYQIIGIGPGKNTLTFEELIYGKTAIDSLLAHYNYKGYAQITDADFSPADIQVVKDLIEKMSKIKYVD